MFMACPLTSAAYNVILFDISNDKKLIKSYSSSVCNKTVKGPSQNVCCAYFAFVRSVTTIGCLPFKKSFRTAGHVVQNERLLSDVCSNACREVLVARRRPQYPTTGGNNYRQILSASAIIVLSLTRETAVAGCHVHRGILCLTASTHTHARELPALCSLLLYLYSDVLRGGQHTCGLHFVFISHLVRDQDHGTTHAPRILVSQPSVAQQHY